MILLNLNEDEIIFVMATKLQFQWALTSYAGVTCNFGLESRLARTLDFRRYFSVISFSYQLISFQTLAVLVKLR